MDGPPAPAGLSPLAATGGASGTSRQPTAEERARESIILKAFAADMVLCVVILVNSLVSGSLTLFAEFIRGTLMTLLDLVTYVILRRIHRGRFTGYDYGTGKLEQLFGALIAASLVLAGMWIFTGAVESFFTYTVHSPWGLALAAITNALNLTLNFVAWFAMRLTAGEGASPVFAAQLHARFVKLLASASIQVTLTLSALALDNVVASWLDAIGAIFVAFVTIRAGAGMLQQIMPDLLDKAAPVDVAEALRRALAEAGIPAEDIGGTRSRTSGGRLFLELAVAPGCRVPDRLPRLGVLLEGALPRTTVVFCFAPR
ncbi:MAG TPA: cation transporter [Microvirga sp.]|jgi:divalent metal cation (Fe/Co/Zn/Cd) transporter|nr:cation transporter [Microvirga sp.]